MPERLASHGDARIESIMRAGVSLLLAAASTASYGVETVKSAISGLLDGGAGRGA